MTDFIDPSSAGDGASSGSSSSPWSILNKMPTKRIDAAIARAAETNLTEQGAQTGGYTPRYMHLSSLPLLPLYSLAQHEMLAQKQATKDRFVRQMDMNDPDKLLTGGQKAFLGVMGHLSGAGSVVGAKRWERRLQGASVVTTNMVMQQDKLIVFTRWTVPAPTVPQSERQQMPWFVDVLEYRAVDPSTSRFMPAGTAVGLKVGFGGSIASAKKINLRLSSTEAKGLKNQEMWSKIKIADPCEAVAFVGEKDGQVWPMEIVARIQRTCSSLEAAEVQKRFKKEWLVPVVQ